jgi:hypothetical protein
MEGEQMQLDVSSIALTDIDDKAVTLADFKGKVLAFVGGHRPAAEQSDQWLQALVKECSTMQDVKVGPLAFIGKLPMFISKESVKGELKKVVPLPLIDWDGSPQKTLGVIKRNVSYVLVIDKQGMLRFRMAALLSDENLKTAIEQIKKFAV